MTPELQKEFDELNKYKEFAKLFLDIFDIEYSLKNYTLSLIPQYPYCIGSDLFNICLIEEDANKILEVAKLLEQDEVEEDD